MNFVTRFVLCSLAIFGLLMGTVFIADEPIGQIPPPAFATASNITGTIGQNHPPFFRYLPYPDCYPCANSVG